MTKSYRRDGRTDRNPGQRSTHTWGPEGKEDQGRKDRVDRELGREISVVSSVDCGRREKKLPGLSIGGLGWFGGRSLAEKKGKQEASSPPPNLGSLAMTGRRKHLVVSTTCTRDMVG